MAGEDAGEAAPRGALLMPVEVGGTLFEVEHGALDALPSARLGGGAKGTGALTIVKRDQRRIAAKAAVETLSRAPRLLLKGSKPLSGILHAHGIARIG